MHAIADRFVLHAVEVSVAIVERCSAVVEMMPALAALSSVVGLVQKNLAAVEVRSAIVERWAALVGLVPALVALTVVVAVVQRHSAVVVERHPVELQVVVCLLQSYCRHQGP